MICKEMGLSRATFPKSKPPVAEIYGPNVVTAEDDEWKRHRRISAPAFSEVRFSEPISKFKGESSHEMAFDRQAKQQAGVARNSEDRK